jgi:hypothetical protein
MQFAEESDSTESEETMEYRMRLEGWALALEVMLEEVLTELESLRSPGPQSQQDLI